MTQSATATLPQTEASYQRLLFVDMFRGLAVLVMIQGHVSNSTILESIQRTQSFHYLSLLNGMIAPSFVFIAGFAFALILQRRWLDFLRLKKPFWLQLKRILFILFTGYFLHLPVRTLSQMLALPQQRILFFLRTDILQLIAVSLLLLLLFCVVIRQKQVIAFLVGVLALLIIFSTPFVHELNPLDYFPKPIAPFLNSATGSLFPMFPWTAYALSGLFLGWIFLQVKGTVKERRYFRILMIAGFLMLTGAFALFYVPWSYHTYKQMAVESPRSFMMRLGWVLMWIGLLWHFEQWRKPKKSFLNIAGQESLMVYSVHLILVYGWVYLPFQSISGYVGRTLTYLPSFFISFVLIALMMASAVIWHEVKNHFPRAGKAFFYLLMLYYAFRFLR